MNYTPQTLHELHTTDTAWTTHLKHYMNYTPQILHELHTTNTTWTTNTVGPLTTATLTIPQSVPPKPGRHVQVNVPPATLHVPLFLQGLGTLQGFAVVCTIAWVDSSPRNKRRRQWWRWWWWQWISDFNILLVQLFLQGLGILQGLAVVCTITWVDSSSGNKRRWQ